MCGISFCLCVSWLRRFDGANALYSVTYELDKKYKTDYHERFKKYWIEVQDQDLMVDGAMTDTKGDRSKRPNQQPDPDAYLHVVDENDEGIIVRCVANSYTSLILRKRGGRSSPLGSTT